jgi:hypothetical protein
VPEVWTCLRWGSFLVEEVDTEVSKRQSSIRRIISTITPEIEDNKEEDIRNSIYESETDCVIVASSRSNLRTPLK